MCPIVAVPVGAREVSCSWTPDKAQAQYCSAAVGLKKMSEKLHSSNVEHLTLKRAMATIFQDFIS